MIHKYKKSFIFYRHAWLGSALLVGGIISSIIVSYTVNRYPEEFDEERKELENLKDWD